MRTAVPIWICAAALGGAGLSASCFDPRFPADRPCGADGWCPPGQGCIDMVCRLPGYVPPSIDARVETPDAETPMVAPDDASLELLAPSAGALTPAFDREVTAYTLEVSSLVQAVLWEAKAAHPEARVRVAGMDVMRGRLSPPISVGDGATMVEIEVMAPAGNSRSYTVMVTRGESIAQASFIKPDSPIAGSNLGYSIALSGDTLAVSAPVEDTSGVTDSGAVYVFRRSGGVWVEEAKLTSDVPRTLHEFGLSVALDGDTLAVGEPGNAGETDSPGSVHVFRRKNGTWTREARLQAEIPHIGSELGVRLALDGDRLVVGAHLESGGGSAYVFRRDDADTWIQEARLQASNADADDGFGFSVAIHEDVIVIGARNEDSAATGVGGDGSNDAAQNSGAAYVFRRNGNDTWTQEAYLKASDTGEADRFGYRVDASRDLVVVSAPCQDEEATLGPYDGEERVCRETSLPDDPIRNSGAVYVFGRDGQSWSQRALLTASNLQAHAHFGHGLAVRDGLLAVGAHDEDGSDSGIGAVYSFDCTATCSAPDRLTASQPGDSDAFGFSVDLGVDGLAVTSPYEDSAATDSGAAHLFQ